MPPADEPRSVPLPPEQRGKVQRCLADDDLQSEGCPGPADVAGGAANLALDAAACALYPFTGVSSFSQPSVVEQREARVDDAAPPAQSEGAVGTPERSLSDEKRRVTYLRKPYFRDDPDAPQSPCAFCLCPLHLLFQKDAATT